MFELMVFQVLFNNVLQYSERWGQKNNTLVSGNAGDKKNLHPGGHKFGFLSRFSRDIIFSSLVYFAFLILVFLLLFVWCFLNLKMYILMHIRLCGRVSDKVFTWPISGNKTTFFSVWTIAQLAFIKSQSPYVLMLG